MDGEYCIEERRLPCQLGITRYSFTWSFLPRNQTVDGSLECLLMTKSRLVLR